MEYKYREPSSGLRRRHQFNKADVVELRNGTESLLTENIYQSIVFFSPDKLIPFKNQWRSYFDQEKLESLAETIKQHGIRQPLTIIASESEKEKFEIVSGERRYRAAIIAGLDRIPCIIIHDQRAAEEIALIENLQRENLHPIELGIAYKRMLDNGMALSQSELALKICVPRTQINEYLHYANIPVAVATVLIEKNISKRSILRKIVKCSEEEQMFDIISNKRICSVSNKILELYFRKGEIEYRIHGVGSHHREKIIKNLEEILVIYRSQSEED